MLSKSLAGRALHCIIYAGMVEEDAWTRIVLPAKDNRLAFQPTSFYLTLSRTKLKSWLLDPRCIIGKPRYLPRLGVEENPKMSQRASRVSLSTLGEKNTLYLASLIDWLDLIQNTSKASLIAEQLLPSALAKSTRSSAKNRWEKAILLLEALTGIQTLSLHFSSIKWPKTSMQKIKR